ncbi:hypothetical protein T10_5951 [Trichinella papuae]|uniref:Uncharacterized protein n=1 Tax=Trichinella papuae TaxID=268474 RepID=A0A0V1MRW4_9BILA|nr:hypothetical protein T10_5951 [Trichinella papuae]
MTKTPTALGLYYSQGRFSAARSVAQVTCAVAGRAPWPTIDQSHTTVEHFSPRAAHSILRFTFCHCQSKCSMIGGESENQECNFIIQIFKRKKAPTNQPTHVDSVKMRKNSNHHQAGQQPPYTTDNFLECCTLLLPLHYHYHYWLGWQQQQRPLEQKTDLNNSDFCYRATEQTKCLPIDHKHLPVVIHRWLIVAQQLSGCSGQQTVIVVQMKDELVSYKERETVGYSGQVLGSFQLDEPGRLGQIVAKQAYQNRILSTP